MDARSSQFRRLVSIASTMSVLARRRRPEIRPMSPVSTSAPPSKAHPYEGTPLRGHPLVGAGKEAFGEADEDADAGRDRAVVEIVFRVVQKAAALARAVAEPQHRARTLVEEVREILAAH